MNDTVKWIVRIVPLVAVLFAFMPCLHAQDIKDTLKEIKVIDARKQKVSNDERINNFSPGQKVRSIDSITLVQYQAQQVSTLLTQQVPAFVRSYGFNNLATLNFRGSSAAQSLVLWNGVPLVYAALGMTDVSLLPVSLVNKVNIVYGGSAALWGSGNVGGAVLLEDNAPVFDTAPKAHISAMLAAGSYSRYNGDIKASFSNRKWFVSANVFGQTAVNDFAYTDTFKHIDKTMDNARLRGAGGVVRAAYKMASQNILSFTAWYQHYYREIPPALFETISYKQQQDASLRLLLDWKHDKEHSSFYAKSAFIRDNIHYSDSALSIVTDNLSYQLYEEFGWKEKINEHHQFLVFVPVTLAWMQQLITHVTKQQTKAAVAMAYSLSLAHSKLHFAINARGEIINSQSILLPGADGSFALTKWLSIRANAQRTYRVPTLGELYTFPGGDSSLKPEQGWTEDVGYTVKTNLGQHISFYHDLSYFNRNINDWIIWFGGAIWTPHNIASVHSRGMETENRLLVTAGKWQFHAGLNTSYVLAVTTASYIPGDSSIGKQIAYTPRYNGQLNIGFAYRGLYLNYNHTYTGYRFYTSDESGPIPPYNTGNIQASYSARLGIPFTLFASCNNVWSQRYQVVYSRPMPGVNWLVGLRADIL